MINCTELLQNMTPTIPTVHVGPWDNPLCVTPETMEEFAATLNPENHGDRRLLALLSKYKEELSVYFY